MTAITENSTAQVRVPVAPKASFDALKSRGVCGWDETSGTFTLCPEDDADFIRLLKDPRDTDAAGALSGSEILTIVQSGAQVQTPIQAIADLIASGSYQPLDSDLTAIAALATHAYGRGFLTLENIEGALAKIGTNRVSGQFITGEGAEQTFQEFVSANKDCELMFYTQGTATLRIYDDNVLFHEAVVSGSGFYYLRVQGFDVDGFVVTNGVPAYVTRLDTDPWTGNFKVTAQGAAGNWIVFRHLIYR